jgi:hypothetical protein
MRLSTILPCLLTPKRMEVAEEVEAVLRQDRPRVPCICLLPT